MAGIVAVAITVASLWWLRGWSPRASTPNAQRAHDALQVHWIRRLPPALPPPAPAPGKRAGDAPAATLRKSAAPPRAAGATMAQEDPVSPDLHLPSPGEASERFAPDPLRRSTQSFDPANAWPRIVMRDAALRGRIAGMSAASACSELRALLRRPDAAAPSPDVILRSMQARGCSP